MAKTVKTPFCLAQSWLNWCQESRLPSSTRKKWSNSPTKVWVTNQSHLCSATSHCNMLYCPGPSPSLREILQNATIRNSFFPLRCRPGYKNMQKTVLYKCKKRCTNEWNSISYNRCHSNCDLGKISLKMCVDFWNRIPICISNTCSFFKNGCWKILELKNTWKKPFEPHYSNTAHSEKAAIFALTSGTCLRLPLPPSGDSSIVRSVY